MDHKEYENFPLGYFVEVTGSMEGENTKGLIGQVIGHRDFSEPLLLVRFDNFASGHNGCGIYLREITQMRTGDTSYNIYAHMLRVISQDEVDSRHKLLAVEAELNM